jgi:hypothetical protein
MLSPAGVLGNYDITYNTADFTIITVAGSVFVLNPQVSGAFTISGNASLSTGGTLFVDSSSSTAISASGNAQVTATGGVLVVGGVRNSGNADVIKTGTPATTVDPYSRLVAPTASGTVMSVNLGGNSTQTVNPGTYSQIKVSGNAHLTLNPGIYVIAGGGMSVTGNASVTGTGVLIYNAGSNVLGGGGTPSYGGVTLSGNGTFNLTALTSEAYPGILIFQARDNTRAMSLSGNAITGIAGTIYAPAALLAVSGNGQLLTQVSLVVDRLQVSGNGSSALATDGVGTGAGITAGELLAGDLFLYVDNPNGFFNADDLTRLDEAIANLDVLLTTYNVTIAEVSDRNLANLVLDIGTTSAAGGYADGVLGCFTNTGEITLIQGWNWYAGVNPAAIGAGQYDFQTIVTHELGHALGLGHSTDAGSVMYATLDTGAVRRTMTVADLNLRDTGSGADALHAVPIQAIAAYAAMMPAPSGLGPEAKDAFSSLPAVTPSAASLTSEMFGRLESFYTSGGESATSLLLGEPWARELGLARRDRAMSDSGYEQAVDFVLDGFERIGFDDALLGQLATSRNR